MKRQLQAGLVAAAGFGSAFMVPAHGSSLLTYDVSGTFDDGGTFAGSFGYDPIANAYSDANGDQFAIRTTETSQNAGNFYTSYEGGDSGSTATELSIFAPAVDGYAGESTFTLTWNTPLNAPNGGSVQPITGGFEFYEISDHYGNVTYLDDRKVATGYVELQTAPVPLPASAWLMLSGVIGLGALVRKRHTA